MKNDDLTAIRRLVGAITKEQLRYIDCFVADEIALFMPVGGPCFYALTPEHTHPAYKFVYHTLYQDTGNRSYHGTFQR